MKKRREKAHYHYSSDVKSGHIIYLRWYVYYFIYINSYYLTCTYLLYVCTRENVLHIYEICVDR